MGTTGLRSASFRDPRPPTTRCEASKSRKTRLQNRGCTHVEEGKSEDVLAPNGRGKSARSVRIMQHFGVRVGSDCSRIDRALEEEALPSVLAAWRNTFFALLGSLRTRSK